MIIENAEQARIIQSDDEKRAQHRVSLLLEQISQRLTEPYQPGQPGHGGSIPLPWDLAPEEVNPQDTGPTTPDPFAQRVREILIDKKFTLDSNFISW